MPNPENDVQNSTQSKENFSKRNRNCCPYWNNILGRDKTLDLTCYWYHNVKRFRDLCLKGDFDLERRGQKSQEVTSFDKNEKMRSPRVNWVNFPIWPGVRTWLESSISVLRNGSGGGEKGRISLGLGYCPDQPNQNHYKAFEAWRRNTWKFNNSMRNLDKMFSQFLDIFT